MMKKLIFICAALIALTGCATRPSHISASFVSDEKYAQNNCDQLSANLADARDNLAKVSKLQDDKANLDAVSVFLVLVPVSQLSGDHAGDVAQCKGEVEAIKTAQIKNKCKQISP